MIAPFSILVVSFGWVLFGPPARQVDISISVVDATTGEAVPDAKIVIYTESYGMFDNSQCTFVRTSDRQGKLSFRQDINYAIKAVAVVAYDPNIERRGVGGAVTYVAYPVTGPRPGEYILFYPNRRHFRVKAKSLTPPEQIKYRSSYEDAVQGARITAHVLSMHGIEAAKER